jgi:peroxiredoxin
LRSFQENLGEFEKRGIRVAAISVDPPELNRRHRQKLDLTFPFLSDTNAAALRRYGLVHEGAGPNGTDIAKPAELLIDSTGTIRWINQSGNASVRVTPENVLNAWDSLPPG